MEGISPLFFLFFAALLLGGILGYRAAMRDLPEDDDDD